VIAVQSSNLAAVDYRWNGTLTVAFHSGGVYEYYGVPQSIYAGLMSAASHGRYFHVHVKNRFPYRRLR
jgi:hypothetical protein